jgi:hypothetical protein
MSSPADSSAVVIGASGGIGGALEAALIEEGAFGVAGFYAVLAGPRGKCSRPRSAIGLSSAYPALRPRQCTGPCHCRGIIADGGLASRAGVALVIVMIALIGGRIVSSFTRNWLAKRGVKQGLPEQPPRFDVAVIAFTAAALLAWIAFLSERGAGAMLWVGDPAGRGPRPLEGTPHPPIRSCWSCTSAMLGCRSGSRSSVVDSIRALPLSTC